MKGKLCRTAAAWVAAAVLLSVQVQAMPVVSAQSAIVMDGATGRVLWEQRADDRALIASTTKIMTGLLVAENCNLQSEVAVTKDAVGIEGSSVYLKTGEVLTVEALLYGMMLHSGNDAAVALAMYCGGSLPGFVEMMNQRAADLGLSQTHYANPHGLDSEENYSTARDLAKLAAFAMENPVFHRVVSTKTATFGNRTFTNHNKLLWRYEGAVGVKTGYTKSAGRILVSCAERNGRRLIAVTINAPNDWKDHTEMLNYSFDAFQEQTLCGAGEILAEVPVIGGAEVLAQAVPSEEFSYPIAEGEHVEMQCQVPVFVYAPVLAGEPAGRVLILIDGKEAAWLPLYWRYSVMEGT